MIDYIHSDLFNQGSVRKDISIAYDEDKQITNNDIVSNSFSINENAFNDTELKFGSFVSSKLMFKIFNTVEDNIINKVLDVKMVLNRDIENPFTFGTYKVFREQLSSDRSYRQIEAYDSLYEVVNLDVADWYEHLTFPMTIKAFRDSFFLHIGIDQVDTTLVNDDVIIKKTILSTTLSGKDVLSAICEINGVIGRINRDNKFTYVRLQPNPEERIVLDRVVSGSGSYEDYNFEPITKVQIRQTDNDIGAIVGEDGNTYIVQNNFIAYGKNNEELTAMATNLLSAIRGVSYKPFKAKFIYGNPCYEIGDAITVVTKNATFDSYIFNRTLDGINAITDNIVANGKRLLTENINSTQTQFRQLERKTAEVVQSVDGIKTTVTEITRTANEALEKADEVEGSLENYPTITEMETAINQSADRIEVEVTRKISKDFTVGSVNFIDGSLHLQGLTYGMLDYLTDENGEQLTDEKDNRLLAIN